MAQEVATGLNTTFTAQEIATIERDIPNDPLALDDSYAPAYAEIGNRLLYLTYYGLGKPEQMKLAEQNLLTALALNDRQMSALSSLALLYTEGGQSVKAMELAVRIDPSDRHFRSLGSTYYNAGYYKKALVAFEIDQGSVFWDLVATTQKAIIEQQFDVGLQALRELERSNINDSEPIYYWAANYAMLGDVKSSLRLLKQAVDGGYYNYPFMLTDLFFDPIRDEQGLKVIIEQARVKHLAFKAKL